VEMNMYGIWLIVTQSLYTIQQRAAIVTHVAWQGIGYKKAILEIAPDTKCLALRFVYDNSMMYELRLILRVHLSC